jgi:cystathionine beta-lyase family protein involved in aluminum resistance
MNIPDALALVLWQRPEVHGHAGGGYIAGGKALVQAAASRVLGPSDADSNVSTCDRSRTLFQGAFLSAWLSVLRPAVSLWCACE